MSEQWEPARIARKRPIVPGGGLLAERRKTKPTVTLPQLREQIIKSCEYMSFVFSELIGGDIKFDCARLKASLADPNSESLWLQQFEPILHDKFKGVFTREHILSLAHLVHQFLNDDRDILIWGACQSAKTILLAAGVMLLPAFEYLYRGRRLIPAIDTPNRTNLSLSVVKELETLYAVYNLVELVIDGDRLPLSYVKENILDHLVKERVSGGMPNWSSLIFQRNNSEIKKFIELMKGQEIVRVRFIDEIHYGSGQDSCQAVMDSPFVEDGELWRRIGVTATPSEVFTRFRWSVVPLWIDERHYQGVTRYNGRRLPTLSGEEPKRPTHRVIEDHFPSLGKYLGIKKFERLQPDQQREMASELLKVYKSLVSPEFPVLFVRPLNYCNGLSRLLELMRELNNDPNYQFLKYFDELGDEFGIDKKTTKRTVKEVLTDEYPPHGGKYCMVISGRGRSQFGDSYPKHVKYFIDLTNKTKSFWDNILQSTEGRAGGFGKESVIYYSQGYIEDFDRFFMDGCKDNRVLGRKRQAQRVDFSDVGKSGRPSVQHEIWIDWPK